MTLDDAYMILIPADLYITSCLESYKPGDGDMVFIEATSLMSMALCRHPSTSHLDG